VRPLNSVAVLNALAVTSILLNCKWRRKAGGHLPFWGRFWEVFFLASGAVSGIEIVVIAVVVGGWGGRWVKT